MKKILLLVTLVLLFTLSRAQNYQYYPMYGGTYNRLEALSSLHLPSGAAVPGTFTTLSNKVRAGAIFVDTSGGDAGIYVWYSGSWHAVTGGGGISDGDKGDITVGSSGTTLTIDNNAVNTAKIGNSQVTLAKIANIGNQRVLGNISGSSAAPAELYVDLMDTTDRNAVDTAMLVWLPDDRQYVHIPYSSLGGGGGGAYIEGFKSFMFPGARDRDPLIGDSIVQRDTFQGRCIEYIIRNGRYEREGNIYQGYEYDPVTGTITFHPEFVGGEEIELRFGNCIDSVQIAEPGSPPAVWAALDFPTNTALTETADVWEGTTNNNWDQYGLADVHTSGDGAIAMRYTATTDRQCILAFNTSNTSQNYTGGYEYAVYLANSGAFSAHSASSNTSVGTLSTGDWIAVFKEGSTVTLKKSTDNKATWSAALYTFPTPSATTLYVNLNVFRASADNGRCTFPQQLNLIP